MALDRILWLTEPKGISDGQKMVVNAFLQKEKISLSQILFVSLEREAGTDSNVLDLQAVLEKYIKLSKPRLIVCNSPRALEIFNPHIFKHKWKQLSTTLRLCRGSVYSYASCHPATKAPIDALVLDDVRSIHMSNSGRWMMSNDIQKLGRWLRGQQRAQPVFKYKVCRTLHDLLEAKAFLLECTAISKDIETHGGQITVDGMTGLHPDGRVMSYCIPFYNPFKPKNRHWNEEDEVYAWKVVKEINECAAVKVLQNGAYDSAYYIRYGVPLGNYTIDCLHLFHSIWAEAPKKLNVISSICLDYCRYWKDEAKGDAKKKGSVRFKTEEDLERYWRYNALDCYNTILNARVLTALVGQLPWAKRNYAGEFALQVGPALLMSMRGLRVDVDRLEAKRKKLQYEHEKNLAELRTMCDDPEFNPNSPPQFAHLLYKVLGAQMPKLHGKAASKLGEQSTDQTVLKMIALQHPLIEAYIKKVWAVKKPKNNVSKYCNLDKFWRTSYGYRFIYNLNAAGTETTRFSGGKHQFWVGTNPQNVPGKMRDMCRADPGFVFFEPDFSQSDARFVAYESQDPVYIKNVESGLDTHCLHASHFFRPMDYDTIYKGYKSGDPFFADDVTGIRAITKKIVHGKNYNMGGFTLYMLMGRKAVVAAARAKGHANPEQWDDKRITSFCQSLLDDYNKMYARLKPWQEEELKNGVANGNRISVAYGHTRLFLGDLRNDKATQREAIAYFGQGGTAGNINRCLRWIYYSGFDDNRDVMLLTQTHDSLLFQLREEKFQELAKQILTVMEEPVSIHGRMLRVPADGKAGYYWGGGLVKYRPDLTIEEMRAQSEKLRIEHENHLKEIPGNDAEDGEEPEDEDDDEAA